MCLLKFIENIQINFLIMAKAKGHIQINIENCKGCALCTEACPQNILSISKNLNNKGYHYSETVLDGCTGCSNCAIICPDGVIIVYKDNK